MFNEIVNAIVYTTDTTVLKEQNDSAKVGKKASRGVESVVTLLSAAAWCRSAAKVEGKEFATLVGLSTAEVSKAKRVLEIALPTVLEGSARKGFAVSDDEIKDLVVALVESHNFKAVSGIYSAITEPQDKWTLEGACATLIASARKREIADSAVLEMLVSMLEG